MVIIVIIHGIDESKDQAQTNNDVDYGEQLTEVSDRVEVTITDGRKRNYREVERIDPGPVFEPMIDQRACGHDQAGSE